MTLITGKNFLPKIYRVTEEQDQFRHIPGEVTFDIGQVTPDI
jgi:hypothetical protein